MKFLPHSKHLHLVCTAETNLLTLLEKQSLLICEKFTVHVNAVNALCRFRKANVDGKYDNHPLWFVRLHTLSDRVQGDLPWSTNSAQNSPAYWTINFLILDHWLLIRGPVSSVGIATDYGLGGPGSNPGGDEIFRPSRPALRPTQPPVQWVPDLSRG